MLPPLTQLWGLGFPSVQAWDDKLWMLHRMGYILLVSEAQTEGSTGSQPSGVLGPSFSTLWLWGFCSLGSQRWLRRGNVDTGGDSCSLGAIPKAACYNHSDPLGLVLVTRPYRAVRQIRNVGALAAMLIAWLSLEDNLQEGASSLLLPWSS